MKHKHERLLADHPPIAFDANGKLLRATDYVWSVWRKERRAGRKAEGWDGRKVQRKRPHRRVTLTSTKIGASGGSPAVRVLEGKGEISDAACVADGES